MGIPATITPKSKRPLAWLRASLSSRQSSQTGQQTLLNDLRVSLTSRLASLACISVSAVLSGCASPESGGGDGGEGLNSRTSAAEVTPCSVTWRDDEAEGALTFVIDGREVLTYQYHPRWALPHIWPLNSPSGKSLLVQKTEPFPHHRSLWLADKLQLENGPVIDYYHEWKNLIDKDQPELGHHSFIRHDGLIVTGLDERSASASTVSTWIAKGDPVLAQFCTYELQDLGNQEYVLHMKWQWRADYGDVYFRSDWVHYGWPYLRMDPAFSGESGGSIVSDDGARGQKATNKQFAKWMDYSSTVDGVTEGLTVYTPNDGQQRRWLTREYGTFGPRRAEEWNGTNFTLAKGESLHGEVKILVHRGNAESANVGNRDLINFLPTRLQ